MLVVLARDLRPFWPVVGVLLWILWGMFPPASWDGQSLLDILIHHMRLWKTASLSLAASSNSRLSGFYVSLVSWTWRALEDFLTVNILLVLLRMTYCLYHYSWNEWKELMTDNLFEWTLNHVPTVEQRFDDLTEKMMAEAGGADKAVGKDPDRDITLTLPTKGLGPETVIKELEPYSAKENEKWAQGKLSGTVYQGDPDHTKLMNEVFKLYTWANPLHAGYWPKLNQCEAEVIAMTSAILNAPEGGFGSLTSGGTESIICAIKASLGYYGKRRGIQHPELICGTSAHAAVDKACEILGIRQIKIDCSQGSCALSPENVKSRITSNTIMIYASAPTYPQGVIDPIQELSQIAMSYNIGLHVDACLGGFVLAFTDNAQPFDFTCPGVTSMSIDTHKYAYAAKGTSVVLYRYKKLRQAQYFCYSKWSGGMYATPTLAGSRPGALVVCAWAALMSLGEDGYRERAKTIVDASRQIAKGIEDIPGIRLLTENPSVVVCFTSDDTSDDMDIYSIGKRMGKKGWTLNELQNPASLHICVTLNVAPKAETLVNELRQAIEEERLESKGTQKRKTAGVYGMAGGIPEGPVNYILKDFLDALLSP